MPKIVIEQLAFKTPAWSSATLKPGEDVTLSVDAPKIKGDQHIEFRIRAGKNQVDVVSSDPGKATAKWKPFNYPGEIKLVFDALLKEKPSPANGHRCVVAALESPEADWKGYKVEIETIDAAFVPNTEDLTVKYKITDATGAATKGRIEVWGERYPSDKPVYTEDFVPAAGSKTWTWKGKGNDGVLNAKFLTPEFAPYRIRIVIGLDDDAVKDPYGKGAAKTASVESPFLVCFESVWIRIQAGFTERNAGDYTLANCLKVEPRAGNGTYKDSGRLPMDPNPADSQTEVGRIRIPMACHYVIGGPLDQGGIRVGQNYLSGGGTKWAKDDGYYMRPELPIEFELRLRSRVASNNTDAAKKGLFDKEAIGPAKIEPIAEDYYRKDIFDGGGTYRTYWTNAAFKVKRGTHNIPQHSGTNKALFSYWQARFAITVDNTVDFDIHTKDNSLTFTKGASELKVFLNRTLLFGDDVATDDELKKGIKDYKEVNDHTLKLRPDLTKADDVLWIVRRDTAANGTGDEVQKWANYPPGVNCHVHYGGFRGKDPNTHLIKTYTAHPGGTKEPIIGASTADFPWKDNDYVNLKPDPAPATDQERVEITALATGAKQGLAGVLFSPSYMAGDSYVLKARVEDIPYERNLGWVSSTKPALEGKTGAMTIWRWLQFNHSWRLGDVGTVNTDLTVGSVAEAAKGTRTYHADGRNMNVSDMNSMVSMGFNEWTMPDPGGATDAHQDVNLATYRTGHNAFGGAGTGKVTLNNDDDVTNELVRWDGYRVRLPPGVPANRRNLVSAKIAAIASGTRSLPAAQQVHNEIGVWESPPNDATRADAPLGGAVLIANYGGNADQYFMWHLGYWNNIANSVLDQLDAQVAQPKKMNVLRWPKHHEDPLWNSFNGTSGLVSEGFCRGSGQSFFRTASVSATLFAHEMGHSVDLVHFVAMNFGWKHHDFNSPNCMMSYTFTTGFVPKPGGAVAPDAGAQDEGWPDRMPAALPSAASADTPTPPLNTPTIQFGSGIAPANPCAKCALKLRGWKEDLLPCAWKHPDLF